MPFSVAFVNVNRMIMGSHYPFGSLQMIRNQ